MANEFNIQQLIAARVLPPIPYQQDLPTNAPITSGGTYVGFTKDAPEGEQPLTTMFGTAQVVPLKFKLKSESEFWLFPVEPLITIEGKNIVTKRSVAKKRDGGGTVKEWWTQDDYSITINGLFTVANQLAFPQSDVNNLVKYCTASEPVQVLCPLFEIIGVTQIVIESSSLPFTKGIENQSYSIQAVSDKPFDLFIKLQ